MEMAVNSKLTTPGRVAWASAPTRYQRNLEHLGLVDLDVLFRLLDMEEPSRDIDKQQSSRASDAGRSSYQLTEVAFGVSTSEEITFFSSSYESPLYATSFNTLKIPPQDIQSLFGSISKDSAWWIDVQNPSKNDLRMLCAAFHIHPLTAEDIWKREKREKFEDFPTYYFACFRSFKIIETEAQSNYEPYTIYVIVLRGGTISVRFTESCHTINVQERIKLLRDHVHITSEWICYALVDDIVDSFAAPITSIEKKVSEIEDQIYTTRIDDIHLFLSSIDGVRKDIVSLLNLLGGKGDVLKRFKKHHKEHTASENYQFVRNDIELYMDDVEDHVITILSNLRHFESILSRSNESYQAQLKVNNAMDVHRTISFMRRALVVTSILTLFLGVCGLFSMNTSANYVLFTSPSPAWAIIIGSCSGLGIVILILAKRYRFY